MRAFRVTLMLTILVGALGVADRPVSAAGTATGKIPVTTGNEAARQEYLAGRSLQERLRVTDSRAHFQKAAQLDPGFALAQYGLATTAQTANEFFAALHSAVAVADKVSDGEARMIRALEAGANGQPDVVRKELTALVAAYPQDERARVLLGGYFFGRQEWQKAVEQYQKATAIDPQFSPPYNQLGYALRFLESYAEAEKVFKKYVELVPDEPNPFDSYAELLMKMGRFDDSITQYRMALKLDQKFFNSYVGIAIDEMLLGHPADARKTLAGINAIARTPAERRQVCIWGAASYVHQGDTKGALSEVAACQAIAAKDGDAATVSGDLNLKGNILLEAGQLDSALAAFKESAAAIDTSSATPDAKEATHRNHLFDLARVALARKDLVSAEASAAQYRAQVDVHKIPFEVWRSHELAGRIAAAKGNPADAVKELAQANQQDPRVLLALGEAQAAAGNADAAGKTFEHAANFNGLNFNHAFVRAKALARLKG